MPSRFAVIEFYPDIVRGERVNVGILAWDVDRPDEVVGRYIRDLSRVEAFAGGPQPLLRGIIERADFSGWTAERIEKGMSPMSCLQIRAEGSSVSDRDETLERIAARFLVEP